MEDVDALADDAFALPVQPYRTKDVAALADNAFKSDARPSPAAQIRAALEREKSHTEYVAPIQVPPTMEEEERVVRPSDVIARGGVYASQPHPPHPPHSLSAPPSTMEKNPDSRTMELRRKAEESRRIINESRRILDQQWPDTQSPVPERPMMVSTGTMTSPPPSPLKKPSKEILRPTPHMALPSPKLHAQEPRSTGLSSQFVLQETEVKPYRSKSPLPSPAKVSPQKEYMRTESPRPVSRSGHDIRSPLGKGLPKPRPQSLYVDNDLEFLRSYDKHIEPLERSHTGRSTASQPASLPSSDIHHIDSEKDLDFLRHKDEEYVLQRHTSDLHRETSRTGTHGRRSSSSGPTPLHHRQTSLSALSKGIMSGKFGDAFRKFEGFSHHDPKPSDSRLRAEKTLAKISPEQAAMQDEPGADWRIETEDIPVKMRQHLHDTRQQSAERQYTLGNPKPERLPTRAITTSSRARMIQQRMNDLLNAQNKEKQPPLTADGYGPYISDARVLRNPADHEESPRKPGVMPKPNVLRRPSLKGSVDM
jgi:AP2-associated kinase